MLLGRPPHPLLQTGHLQKQEKYGWEGGVRVGLGLGCGGMGDRVPILQYLSILIIYSYTAGKATK